MKTIASWHFLISLFFSAAAQSEELAFEAPPKTEIMVLGTYHMANPGKDSFNLEADDVLSATRQAEILDLVIALSTFKPTKIAIESDYNLTTRVEKYQAYRNGEYELTRNEIDQISYRLAKMMGHDTVYPVDFDWGMGREVDFRGDQFETEFADNQDAIDAYGKSYTALEAEFLASHTVGQYLAFLNTKDMLAANHRFYAYYSIRDGAGDWFPGPHMVANWYKRNLYIVHNLTRIANPDGSDRILVIFGQGHAYLLKQFLNENPAFEVVDVEGYLPD